MAANTWLFAQHPESELRRWATSLRFFRFCRAYGGHANDGDAFRVALAFDSEVELHEICDRLGLPLNRLPRDEPRPVPGRPYPAAEFARFRTPIDDFPHLEQPGHRELHGVPAFVWVPGGRLVIALAGASGDAHAVDESDFRNAFRLERALAPLAARIVDPPQDDDHCISPKSHPEFWSATGA